MEKPLSGWGYKPFDEIISSGIPWIVPSFRAAHFHSDFFNNLVSNGLIGSLGWLTTIVLLFKSIKNNSALLALLLTSLAMGISECIWFDNKTSLPIIVCLWILFSTTNKNSAKE